jgi:GNAT superfamily N-acetyltransferase
MGLDWHPELYTQQDLPALVSLSRLMPGKAANVTSDYVNWMHDGNPAGPPLIAVARNHDASRIIGQVWLMPLHIHVRGETRLGALSFYGLVDPTYQRQGVFSSLVSYCSDASKGRGIQFSYGFPNHRSFPVFVRRLGWAHLGNAREYLLPIDLPRLIRRRFQRQIQPGLLASIGKLVNKAYFKPKPLPAAAGKFDLMELEDTTGLGGFWKQVRDKYTVMVVRNASFMDWRYFQIPDRQYRVWAARKGPSILATLVLRCVVIKGINCGMVVDFLVEPTDDGRLAGEFLLAQARDYFVKSDTDLAGCLMISGSEEINLLKRQGYRLCPTFLQSQPHPVILETHPETPDRKLLHHLHHWFLSLGDFDAV